MSEDTDTLFHGSHYHLIRTNPEYRMRIIAEEMMLNNEPAWAQPEAVEEPLIEITNIPRHLYDQQQTQITEQRRMIKYLERAVRELSIDKNRKRYSKYE